MQVRSIQGMGPLFVRTVCLYPEFRLGLSRVRPYIRFDSNRFLATIQSVRISFSFCLVLSFRDKLLGTGNTWRINWKTGKSFRTSIVINAVLKTIRKYVSGCRTTQGFGIRSWTFVIVYYCSSHKGISQGREFVLRRILFLFLIDNTAVPTSWINSLEINNRLKLFEEKKFSFLKKKRK